MSMNVGELAAYLTLDDTQFQSKLGNAKGGLSGLGNLAKGAGQVVASALTAGTTAATAMAVALVKTGVSYNVLQQNSRAALTTLLGSQTAVNAQMEKLNELTQRSPFGKDIFIQAQQQLISFGMAAEKVVPTLDAVQNAVAATGGSGQQLSEITFVLAQIQAAGKITGQDLMQLGQRGIDAATLMGNSLGKSGAEIRKDITAGTLDAGTAIDALVQGMTAKFGGATDLIKQQWSGATDRIKAAWRDTGAVIAEPFIDPNGGGQAVIWANLVADTMRTVQGHVVAAMRVVDSTAGPTFSKITKGLQDANVVAKKFDITMVLSQVETLGKYTPLISGATTALLTLGLKPVPGLGKLAEGMGPLLVGVTALIAASPELRGVGTAFTDALAPAGPQLQEAGKGAADLAMELIDALTPGLTQAATGVGGFISDMSPLVPMLVDAATAVTPLVGDVADLAGWVANLPTPLLAAAAAMVAFHSPTGKIADVAVSAGKGVSSAVMAVSQFIRTTSAVSAETGVSKALVGMQAASSGVGGALSKLITPTNLVGAGLTVLTGVVAMYAAKKAEAKQRVDDFRESLDDETGALTDNTRALAATKLEDGGAIEAYEKLGGTASDLTDALLDVPGAQEKVNTVLDAAIHKGVEYSEATGGISREASGLSDNVSTVNQVLGLNKDALDEAKEAEAQKQRAMDSSTGSVKAQAEALDDLIDKQNEAAGTAMSVDEAQGEWAQQLADNADAVKKLTGYTDDAGNAVAGLGTAVNSSADSWDLSTEAGRLANDTMLDTSNKAWDVIGALKKQGATQGELQSAMQTSRDEFIKTAQQMGMNKTAAEKLADQYRLIPSTITTNVSLVNYGTTYANLMSIQSALRAIDGSNVRVAMGTGGQGGITFADGGILNQRVVKRFAAGGLENHTAQIAPAGAYRLWAEQETGGEAYIPLAQSKRARSTQILAQLAREFGDVYIPANQLRAHANGSVTTAPTPSSPSTLTAFPQRVTLVIRDREFDAFLEETAEGVAIDVINSRR